jgi:hypothetical protein
MTMTKFTNDNPHIYKEHNRELVPNKDLKITCDWCGAAKEIMYRYNGLPGTFCRRFCCREYHW